MFNCRFVNEAIPITAFTVVVLPDVNEPGPVVTAMVIAAVEVVTTLPNWSCTCTWKALKGVPAVPLEARWVMSNLEAVAD